MSAKQQQQQQSTQQNVQAPASKTGNGKSPPNQGERSGMWGWLQNTGDWIADKYDDVTTGVGNWADGVRQSASDIWDVVENTDFSAKDGIWTMNTDLDEIQDVAGIQGLGLDREASDNKVQMQLNRETGEVTIKCSSLALTSLPFEGLSVQSVKLNSVTITVQNASVDAGFLGTLSAKRGGKTNAAQDVSLHAAEVIGMGLKVQDPSINNGQAIEVASLRLQDFNLQAKGSKEIFEDAPNQANFSVAHAIISGIKTQQGGENISGNLAIDGATGGYSTKDGSGTLGIDALSGSQLAAGSQQIESTNFQNVQANIAASGNGHIANLSAAHGAIQNLDTDALDINKADINGFSAQFDTESQALNASTNGLRASGIDGMGTTLNSLQGNGIKLAADLDDNQQSASIEHLLGQGIKNGDSTISQASLDGLSATNAATGASAELASGTLSGLSGYGQQADLLTIGGASLASTQNTQTASINSAKLHGYQSQYGSAELASITGFKGSASDGIYKGSLENASVNNATSMGHTLQNLSIENSSGEYSSTGSNASIGAIRGQGYQSEYGSAGSINLRNLSGSNDSNGSTASIDSVDAFDIASFGSTTDHVQISNATARGNSDLSNSGFGIGNLSVSNLQHEKGSLGSLNVGNIQGGRNNNNYSGYIESVSARNGDIGSLGSAQSLEGGNASFSASLGEQNSYAANLGNLSVGGIKGHTFGTTIEEANIQNAQVSGVDMSEMHASLGSGDVSNFALQGGTLESASFSNAQGNVVAGRGDVSLEEVAFSNGQYEDSIRVSQGVVKGIHAEGTATQQSGGINSASVHGASIIQPQSISRIGEANLHGGHFSHLGDGKGSVGVDNVNAKDLQVDVTDMDKTESISGASSKPITNIDFNEMLASGAQRLDTANIQAEVGLNPMTIGSGMASVGIDKGTNLMANVHVANNQIQNDSTIKASKNLDTALFTSVAGAYVKDGELNADVRGWFDMSVSEDLNNAMGLKGKKLQSIGDYAGAIANMPANEASSSQNPIDFSTLRASGNASLSNGTVKAGDASLNLDGAQKGSNQMSFGATSNQIAMKFAQLLASSFQLNTTMGKGETGEIAVDNGSFTVNPQKGTARGLVDSVSVSDINIQNTTN